MNLRKRLTAAMAGLAVVGAVVVGAATPAAALPPTLVVQGSTTGSPTSQSATATCPTGWVLIGTGGRIDNGGGNVVMTDVIPTVTAGTVTVWGHEKGAYAGNWTVFAYAICDNRTTGVVRVGLASANNATSPKTVTPNCPAGTTLSGVGYQLSGANGEVFPDDVRPNPALDGSLVTAYANGGYASNWSITGYAICGIPPAGATPALVTTVSAFDSTSPKTGTAACAAGSVTGSGGELTGGVGNVVLDQMSPTPALGASNARGNEFGAYGSSWEVISYSICW